MCRLYGLDGHTVGVCGKCVEVVGAGGQDWPAGFGEGDDECVDG
jgi:hypothetical protein